MNAGDMEEAAGGLLWKCESGERMLALVYRDRYGGGWTIPKGKRQLGESWIETAVREVKEETGCKELDLGVFAGCISYNAGNNVKVVLLWNMEMKAMGELIDVDEIKQVKWFTLTAAKKILKYTNEKNFLNTVG
jgi:8-oxo-dGTP diphosphatase